MPTTRHASGSSTGSVPAQEPSARLVRRLDLEETARDRLLHSLHAYFVRPGSYGVPIQFDVVRVRNGTTFAVRRVVASQRGKEILHLTSSFTRPAEGLSHQDPMPAAPEPS